MIYSQLWEEWVVLFSSSQTSPKKKEKASVKGTVEGLWSDRQSESCSRSRITRFDMLDLGQEAHHVTWKPSKLSCWSSAGKETKCRCDQTFKLLPGSSVQKSRRCSRLWMAAGSATAFTSALPTGMSPMSWFRKQPPRWPALPPLGGWCIWLSQERLS